MLPRLWPAVLSLGWILLAVAAAQALMVLVSLAAEDGEAQAFVLSAGITALAGGGCVLTTKGRPFELNFRDAAILTALAWFLIPLFGSVPFFLHPVDLLPVQAYFEAVSAITTTGATVITSIDTQPRSILMWRSTMQWLGGIGIIGLALVVLPFLKIGGMQLFRLESSERNEKQMPRLRTIAGSVLQIYVALTALCFAAYVVLGMTPFDALNHAMTTVCTGGLSTHDVSFGYFQSPALRWTAILFMLAGAVPFLAFLKLVGRGSLRERVEPQIIGLLVVVIGASGVLAIMLRLTGFYEGPMAITEATFNVVSIVTTTGYATTDYLLWGPFATAFFLVLTFVGGSTGSTSGGIKILRFQIIGALIASYIRRTIFPHSVQPIRYGHRTLSDDQVTSVAVFVFVYLASWLVVALALSATGLDIETALSGSASALSNVGPGVGPLIGPSGNFASMTNPQLIILSVAMIMGRLEILGVLVLFARSFYR